jgi:hypothetical protein
MKQAATGLMTMLVLLFLATPALADGALQWGTCSNPIALITDANHAGAPVSVGSLVELWADGGAAPLATARIGEGYLTPQTGRVVANSSVADGSYRLHLRVYDVADPYEPGLVSCAAIVGAGGLGTAGVDVQISTLLPATVCFPSAEIPAAVFDPMQGGCHVISPLAVTLASFEANAWDGGILVRWETSGELDNAGFNIYRGATAVGPWVQLNTVLIPSQAPGSSQGFAYEFLDSEVSAGATYFYLLESVDVAAAATQHGPISIFYSGGPTAVDLAALTVQPAQSAGWGTVALLALASLALAGYVKWRR